MFYDPSFSIVLILNFTVVSLILFEILLYRIAVFAKQYINMKILHMLTLKNYNKNVI